MNSGLECNVEEVFDKFCELTSNEMTSAVRRAIRSGAVELKKQTQSNMSGSFMKRNNHPGKYIDRMEDAVMVGKIGGDFDEDLSVKVHIMGSRVKGSGTFRARFLEKGTKKRHNNKGIAPLWFFKKAQQQVFPNIDRIYMTEIEKAVNKINNSKI